MPAYSLFFMVFMLASIGLPGTGGFVGELLILVGAFKANSLLAALAATGVILSAVYMLYLYRRVIFGKLTKEQLLKIKDLSSREIMVFAPLLILIFWMGIYPSSFLDFLHVSVHNLIERVETAQKTSAALIAGR